MSRTFTNKRYCCVIRYCNCNKRSYSRWVYIATQIFHNYSSVLVSTFQAHQTVSQRNLIHVLHSNLHHYYRNALASSVSYNTALSGSLPCWTLTAPHSAVSPSLVETQQLSSCLELRDKNIGYRGNGYSFLPLLSSIEMKSHYYGRVKPAPRHGTQKFHICSQRPERDTNPKVLKKKFFITSVSTLCRFQACCRSSSLWQRRAWKWRLWRQEIVAWASIKRNTLNSRPTDLYGGNWD